MSNPVVGAIKDQKKILLYLIGFVVVIFFGLTYQSQQSFDFGFSNSYPGYTSSSNNNSGSTTVVNSKYNKYSSAPIMKLKNGVDYWATIETSAGTIEIDLFEKDTPVTVNNFVFLANDNYYDDLIFHYVKKGTLIQGGDPLGDSSGGPGYKFKDEIDAEAIGLDNVTVEESTFLSKLYDQFDEYTAPYSPENLNVKGKLTLKEIEKQSYGISMATEHKLFQEQLGLKLTLQEFIEAYDLYATDIYPKVTLANKLEETISKLKSLDIKLAIVTASVNIWVDLFKTRLNENYFDFILSLADSENLKQKPSPDGYLFAMKHFSVEPENTLVIEDSNRGIQAGKASGATTLASSEFIDESYIQKGYDFKISNLTEISNHLL